MDDGKEKGTMVYEKGLLQYQVVLGELKLVTSVTECHGFMFATEFLEMHVHRHTHTSTIKFVDGETTGWFCYQYSSRERGSWIQNCVFLFLFLCGIHRKNKATTQILTRHVFSYYRYSYKSNGTL